MASNPVGAFGLEAPHASRLVLGAPWGATLPATGSPGLYVMKEGTAWLRPRGEDRPRELAPGSVALLPRGSEHTLASAPDARTPPIAEFFAEHGGARGDDLRAGTPRGREVHVDTFCFRIGSANAQQLIRAAPELVVLHPTTAVAWTSHVARALNAMLDSERRDLVPSIGLTETLFGAALRDLFASGLDGADCAVTLAVALIHADLARPWTVSMLARLVGRSRSSFHDRFARRIGRSPIEYVAIARMTHARELLQTSRASMQEIAEAVGYRSAAAFAVAFRRWSGTTPTATRRRAR